MVAANGISVNVRVLPLFTPFLGAQMTQPVCISVDLELPCSDPHTVTRVPVTIGTD